MDGDVKGMSCIQCRKRDVRDCGWLVRAHVWGQQTQPGRANLTKIISAGHRRNDPPPALSSSKEKKRNRKKRKRKKEKGTRKNRAQKIKSLSPCHRSTTRLMTAACPDHCRWPQTPAFYFIFVVATVWLLNVGGQGHGTTMCVCVGGGG